MTQRSTRTPMDDIEYRRRILQRGQRARAQGGGEGGGAGRPHLRGIDVEAAQRRQATAFAQHFHDDWMTVCQRSCLGVLSLRANGTACAYRHYGDWECAPAAAGG